jgi:hypothetical protein
VKAMVLAMAARVGESAFGHAWRKTGEVLDVLIPIALTAALAVGAASILFGFAH